MANVCNAPYVEFLDLLVINVGDEYFAKKWSKVALNNIDMIFKDLAPCPASSCRCMSVMHSCATFAKRLVTMGRSCLERNL